MTTLTSSISTSVATALNNQTVSISAEPKQKREMTPHIRRAHTRTLRNGVVKQFPACIVHEEKYFKLFTESPKSFFNRMTGSKVAFSTLYHYTGSKAKFYKKVQLLWNETVDKKRVKKILIPFFGGGSDLLNISVKTMGIVDTAIVNDFNPVISGTVKNIRDNREKLKEEIEKITDIDLESADEVRIFLESLVAVAHDLESNKEFDNIRLSAIFIILLNSSDRGIYEWNEKAQISQFSINPTKAPKKKNLMGKVDFLGYFIDGYKEFIVENLSYDDLIEKYAGDDVLTIADPLYVEENHDENVEVLINTAIDYGFDFDHDRCLDVFSTKLKDCQLIYHNYFNTKLIRQFVSKGFDFILHPKKNISRNSDGTYKDCVEIIVFTDNRKKSKKPSTAVQPLPKSNNTEFRPFLVLKSA
ncbi:MAG: DNA adenine methylase [Sulfuricurvum sp.]|nr:DNA adenine methylase [Sulfuricurvum sp.]